MRIPSPVIVLIQEALNKSLQLDPASGERLKDIGQKVVELRITGFETSVYLIFVDGLVEVTGYFDGETDALVSGTPLALAALSRDFQNVLSGEVRIEGDLTVGRKVRHLFTQLEIDWEEVLSHYLGGTAAHQLGRVHRELTQLISRTVTNFQQDTTEYITEESRSVVGKHELGHFLADVDLIREDVDRLLARTELLLESAKGGEL